MDNVLAWLLLLAPLGSAALIQLRLKDDHEAAAKLSVFSVVLTFLISVYFIFKSAYPAPDFVWAKVGDFSLHVGLLFDQLSTGMMFIVTGVGMLVHIFSLGYMAKDEAKGRYFGGLSIFMFSMTGIVLANNFIMMFMFWELVGLSSYLLIGHWFQKDSAADAAKKAFLVNRIGDFGFMIGILMLWGLLGQTFVFTEMKEVTPLGSEVQMGIAVLLIFCGAVGKSAQFPLHVWLPDAMEGPTPVSALIHAATMVAAGVYMLVRVEASVATEIFTGFAGTTIAWIGAITSLLAALMATQQDDIKRILAYSTLSQLGYMVMAVGLAHGEAGMFHLYTHAWFKALLFLGAGAVIYACHHEQNIWQMGGLLQKMRKTGLAFAFGTAALIAVPFTSGFWSKEQILHAAHAHPPLFWIAVVVAVLTPFYMTRLYIVAFLGEARDEFGSKGAKEVPPLMLVPLIVLAVLAVISGYKFMAAPLAPAFEYHPLKIGSLFWISLAAVCLGVGLAFFCYYGRSRDILANNPIGKLFRNKFYLDEIYLAIVRTCQDLVATIVHFFDEFLINGLLVNGTARGAGRLGHLFRRMQSGNLQGYALLFGVGIILVIYLTVFAR